MRYDTTRFHPPFCPNERCPFHRDSTGWRFKKAGFHFRLHPPRRIQRFLCLTCRRNFSFQTFQTTYWLKRPDLLVPTFYRTLACSAFRQIAREFGCSHTTVMRLSERLGRHCLLFQHAHRATRLGEPVVVDGFESFEYSQYYPCHFHVAVGAESHFFYAFTDSELRRKGRMTPAQREKRALLERRHGRPDPRSVDKEVCELLRLLPQEREMVVRTDEHRAYPRALRRFGRPVRHERTSSRKARTVRNRLFAVNLLDLLIRHGGANHKRETIAFSKRRQNGAERLAILQVWRNFVKPFSERRGGGTPAERLGLEERALTVAQVLGRRLFLSRIGLPERLLRYYRRLIRTRCIPRGRTHRLSYAD
jgi:transposase-like protein